MNNFNPNPNPPGGDKLREKEDSTMKYQDFRAKEQDAFNALPIFYAFGQKQFEEALAKRGIKYKDAGKELYRLGNSGGYYLKKDAPEVRAFFDKDFSGELRKAMEDDLDMAYEAFEYEMMNHEYPINWQGDWDVCSCFGSVEYGEDKGGYDYLKELGFSDKVIAQYEKARRHVESVIEW